MVEDEHNPRRATILLAEDDPADVLLARRAFRAARLRSALHVVQDGEELLEYLRQEKRYAPPQDKPRPDIVLLDLNMPRMDGREALAELRSDARFQYLPVIVLTTSEHEADIVRTYDLGASAFITKPPDLAGLVDVVTALDHYWFRTVTLPAHR